MSTTSPAEERMAKTRAVLGKTLAKEIARAVKHAALVANIKRANKTSFAILIDCSTKHVDRLLRRGMPSIGTGRALRIPVDRALEWLDSTPEALTDPDEAAGRRAARRDIARGSR